jgi:23S rRNA pseudouridine1911/1915/1917 synthase
VSAEPTSWVVTAGQAGQTLARLLRDRLPDHSWNQVRRLVAARRVKVGGALCLDDARRLAAGDAVELLPGSAPKPREREALVVRHLDEHLVVVEKPSGLATVRHPAERSWSARRKALHPTLEDVLPPLIAAREGQVRRGPPPRLRVVHRLDKETSGLVVFARTVAAERELGRQFHAHTVVRRYLAVVPGRVTARRIATHLVRDRGDRRRGSTAVEGVGKEAVTHVEPVEQLPGYTLLACRLETGRTHQIRIHLAEQGHPVCGEQVYNRPPGEPPRPDASGAPRLALHAAELGFNHPATGTFAHWTMPLPDDLAAFVDRLRAGKHPPPSAPKGHDTMGSIEIKWTDKDPETGERRFLCAERFAREWSFKWRSERRTPWNKGLEPTREMWEYVLDSLQRRYRRREGVSDEDVEQVERILKGLKQKRDEEE